MALSGLTKQKRIKATPKPVEESASENSGNESEESTHVEGNAGWADSIAKVLNTTKPKTKKTLVLSRAKKIKVSDKNKADGTAADYGFEVDGEVKDEKPDPSQLDEKSKQRKNMPLALRTRPSWKDLERERTLRKVATRGVVQLFNAVRIQQKDLEQQLEEAGPLDSRKDAILNNINKRKFLDVLMSGNRAKSEAVDNPVKNEKLKKYESTDDEEDEEDNASGKKKSEWNVLRDDFMTNKKIKHWDEEDEDSDNNNSGPDDNADESEDDDE